MLFKLNEALTPKGDQPKAIESLVASVRAGDPYQVLLGITGSGKTFTIANVIAQTQKPTLIIAPNKTLAAQLYEEMKLLFPESAVEYFVSYYDYYQPEAYMPSTDTFIEKDAIINERIDRMRHAATRSLLSRRDVIIVSSVSCIYGIGSRDAYIDMLVWVEKGKTLARDAFLRQLVEIQYDRNDIDFHRGTFRVRGEVVEVFPVAEEDRAIRIEFFGDEVERITEIDPLRGKILRDLDKYAIYPGSHYVTPEENRRKAISSIRVELQARLLEYAEQNRLLEKQRLEQRTMFDLEMLEQTGFCYGIENYSRHMTGRSPGEAPPVLVDYFADDFLLVLDESHQTVPQISAMFRGDRARKEVLVDHGFRLPSAKDNRPLQFEEFWQRIKQTIFVSATPGDYELEQTHGEYVEQVIRPTGLLDPVVTVRLAGTQVDDLLAEIRIRAEKNERVLVTTLTKRMAEDLTEYYSDLGVRVKYLHSDIDTLERIEILKALRKGEFDVLVGINLLREGLDLPEVSLVGILDADKEGFLRSTRSLIQTIGRAARNVNGQVILYADKHTAAMKQAMDETDRRRIVQARYNEEHGITPASTVRGMDGAFDPSMGTSDYLAIPKYDAKSGESEENQLEGLRAEMVILAEQLEFEKAARVRDEIKMREAALFGGGDLEKKTSAAPAKSSRMAKKRR